MVSRRFPNLRLLATATVFGVAGCGETGPSDQVGAQSGPAAAEVVEAHALPRARPLMDRVFERTPARLQRGRYLAENALWCVLCHSERDTSTAGGPPLPGKKMAGRVLWDEDGSRMVAPNLTPDSATGAGAWPDDALARAIREGVGHDGRALAPPMRWERYRILSDEDVASIVVYLRSLPPVENPLPARSLPPERLEEIARRPQPLLEPVPEPDFSDPVERGRYLIHLADCVGCHTSWYTDRIPGAFSGGNKIAGVFSTNITHDSSGIGGWNPTTFVQVLRTGKGGTLDLAMPWIAFGGMTDADLEAIYRALGTAPRIPHWIDNTSPPTYCAVCGQMHGLGELNDAGPFAAVSVSEPVLAAYEGRYVGSHVWEAKDDTVEMRLRDGVLWAISTDPDEEPQKMVPLSERRFYVPGWGEQIEFQTESGGPVRGYRSRFGLYDTTYERR
jgi:mono/diheme cytochrome c family protein